MKRIDFDKLEESVIEDWEGGEDIMTYDGDEMEDWSWDKEPEGEKRGYKDPDEELNDYLADSFPTRYSEYQNDEGDYDPFSYVQMGDAAYGPGYRPKSAAYAYSLRRGDYAPTLDDGTVLGGDFEYDEKDADFAMSDDADLDKDWVIEGKKNI